MALDQITQAVLDSARKEADLIIKSAQKSMEDKVASARKTAESEAEKKFQSATRSIEEDLSRKLIQLQGVANKDVLLKKNGQLQQIFTLAKDRILALPPEVYAEIMKKLLAQSASECGGGLRVHPQDVGLFSSLLEEFNQGKDESNQVTILSNQPLAERGGFIFVSEKFQVDQTLATLLSDIQYELAPVISAELFSSIK